jgi:hypothetical protein
MLRFYSTEQVARGAEVPLRHAHALSPRDALLLMPAPRDTRRQGVAST